MVWCFEILSNMPIYPSGRYLISWSLLYKQLIHLLVHVLVQYQIFFIASTAVSFTAITCHVIKMKSRDQNLLNADIDFFSSGS